MSDAAERQALMRKAVAAYSSVLIWIFLSGAVILYNKYILAYSGFPYPISLTMWYATFSILPQFRIALPPTLYHPLTDPFRFLSMQAHGLLLYISRRAGTIRQSTIHQHG